MAVPFGLKLASSWRERTIMQRTAEELAKELAFLRAKASKYAFWGTLIASSAVVIATLLVSYFVTGAITLDGIMDGQQTNIALWALDCMPFIFATWGQYASIKMANEASHFVADKTKTLQQALDELKVTAQGKSEFFSKMSHELRAPLNGVVGMVDMLLDTKLDGEQRRYVGVIKSSAGGLLNLINDILDLSKIEAGKLALEKIEFDFRECIEGCVALLLPQARMKALALETHIAPELPVRLVGDPGRLRQIVINLVNNALKFTERGRITLRASFSGSDGDDARVRIEITDTGIGMSATTLKRLFQPYSQGDSSTARKYGGTGLGLAISKELVESMSGEIGVSSNEHEGSTFWFTVRLQQAQSAPAVDTRRAELKGLRLLLADGNEATRNPLAQQLRHLGINVEEVADGIAALQMILVASNSGYRFDLVLTDMFLPCMSGEELGREIKSRVDTKDIVLLMMTAVGQRGDAQHLNELGFAAYLPKPPPAEDFARVLSAAVATRTMSEEQRRSRGLITRHSVRTERPRPLRVLLADDSELNREIIGKMLKTLGHRYDAVNDGEQAVLAASTRTYDIVLMDLQMPVMDGFDAIRAMRALPAPYARVPIVAITAGVTHSDTQRCLNNGATAVCLKPTRTDDLVAILARALGRESDPKKTPAVAMHHNPEVVKIFLTEATQRLASLNEGVRRHDLRRVVRDAHTLKGASAHFNAEALRHAAAELETLASNGKFDAAGAAMKSLEEAFTTLQFRLLHQNREIANG